MVEPETSELTAINILNVKLSLAELMEMGNNAELKDEVVDLYHTSPPTLLQDEPELEPKTTFPSDECTPTKMNSGNTSQTTPRRSPRGHSVKSCTFIVIKFSITDLVGVDPRLDIPKVLILAQGESTGCQSVVELKECLEDTSNNRMKHQFDLCKSIITYILDNYLTINYFIVPDTCCPSGHQVVSFLREFANCKSITKIPDVSMESLSLMQIGETSFLNAVATLVGVDNNNGDGCAEDHLKEIFMMTGIKYKFQHRTKGIFYSFIFLQFFNLLVS